MTTTLPAGWKPIESAPKNQLVMVYTPPQPSDWPDSVRIGFDYIDTEVADDYWYNHGEHYEHYCCVAKPENCTGPQERAPYTHWMPLPAPPCLTCGGHGMVGGLTPHSGYDAEPCPDCTPPASAQDPITVSLDPDPRGVSVGVWRGSRCIYNGAHALPSAQDDAKDERQAFEAWGLTGCEMVDDPRSMRFDIARHCAWEAWKARAALDAPAAGDARDAARLRRIAWLIGSIFVHGDFKAETGNERELEKLLRENGTFWDSIAQFDAATAAQQGKGGM